MVQGGFWGLVLIGIRRAVFSSESGVGLAPIYHGQSTTKQGTDEGLVGMLGPILDTILVCTITGLIIIISGAYLETDLNGIVLSLEAFRILFFGFGDYILIIMISIFGISTLFTYSYYGVKCYGFLTSPKKLVSFDEPIANSSLFNFPKSIAPSFHRFCVTVDSYGGTKFSSILLEAVVLTPFVQNMSFIPKGMPSRGFSSPFE